MSEIFIRGADDTVKYLGDLQNAITTGIADGVRFGLKREQEDIIRRAPIWRGDLIDGVKREILVKGHQVSGFLFTEVFYAEFVEFGTAGPRFVPAKYIGEWAEDHGFGYTGIIVSGDALPHWRPDDSVTFDSAVQAMEDRLFLDVQARVGEEIDGLK